ncbi:hypothetical protein AML33_18305 [Escherichia coli]|nr:hypothetical protein AML33_18305 [Escherichia coli]
MLPSETMIWQPEFTDKTLSRKPGAVQYCTGGSTAPKQQIVCSQSFGSASRHMRPCAKPSVSTLSVQLKSCGASASSAGISPFL